MVDRPISENGATINKFAGHRTEDARIIRADAMVAHHKVTVFGDAKRAEVAHVFVLRGDVRLIDGVAVDVDDALPNFDAFARQSDDALDKRFRMVERIPENDDIAPLDGFEPIDKFIDKDALLVGEQRSHAGTFDFYRLIEENNDDERQADGDKQIARPNTDFISQGMGCRRYRRWSFRNRWGKRLVLVRALHFCAALYL